MNIIGHPYVAFRVFGRLTEDLVLGSYVPDIVPFVPNSVFSFEEIHESGKKLLAFLEERCPERRDLALGIVCHSLADGFSSVLEQRFEAQRVEYAKRISEASRISLEIAWRVRFHNFLWWGVDVQLLEYQPEFVEDLAEKIPQVEIDRVAVLLAECFNKEAPDVLENISALLKPIVPERFVSVRGLAEIWKEMVVGQPEKDKVDVEKTEAIFKECAKLVEDFWEEFLEEIVVEIEKSAR